MNKLKSIFLALSITAFLPSSIALAQTHDNSHGGTAETGAGTVNFTSGAYRFSNGSFKPDTIITICNVDCSSTREVTAGEFVGGALRDKNDAPKLFNSENVWIRTNATLSAQLGRPVFYSLDAAPKSNNSWNVSGDSKGNRLVGNYIDQIDRNLGGTLKSGAFATVFIYDNMDEITDKTGNGLKVPPPTTDDDPAIGIGYCYPGSKPTYTFVEKTASGPKEIKGPYSVFVRVDPVKPQGFEKLSDEQKSHWEKTHKSQIVGPVLTPFGEYLDKNRETINELKALGKSGGIGEDSNYRKLWDKFEREANEAIAKGIPNVDVVLTAENKEGFGRGGAFTFTETVKEASISTIHNQDLYDRYECVTKYRSEIEFVEVSSNEKYDTEINGKYYRFDYVQKPYQVIEKTGSKVKKDGEYTDGVLRIESPNYTPNRSFQELNVRCNIDEFNILVSRTNSTVQTLGSGHGSATAQSPTVEKSIATFYNDLTTDFYYNGKSCNTIIGCSINFSSSSQEISFNKGKSGNMIGDSFGAQSEDKTSSKFSFFRDNVSREIRNDIWGPVIKTNPAEITETRFDPTMTFITLDTKATPTGEMFTLENKDRKTIIDGNQLSTKNALMFEGTENRFNWKAKWASEKDRPHRMNVKYAYKIKMKNTTINKFNRNGVETGEDEYVLDVYCDVTLNTDSEVEPIIKNQPKEEEYKPFNEFNDNENKFIEVNFVKSSAE